MELCVVPVISTCVWNMELPQQCRGCDFRPFPQRLEGLDGHSVTGRYIITGWTATAVKHLNPPQHTLL